MVVFPQNGGEIIRVLYIEFSFVMLLKICLEQLIISCGILMFNDEKSGLLCTTCNHRSVCKYIEQYTTLFTKMNEEICHDSVDAFTIVLRCSEYKEDKFYTGTVKTIL